MKEYKNTLTNRNPFQKLQHEMGISSDADLALLLNVSPGTVEDLKHGRCRPPKRVMRSLLQIGREDVAKDYERWREHRRKEKASDEES